MSTVRGALQLAGQLAWRQSGASRVGASTGRRASEWEQKVCLAGESWRKKSPPLEEAFTKGWPGATCASATSVSRLERRFRLNCFCLL